MFKQNMELALNGVSDLENLYQDGFAEEDLTDARELIRILRDKRLTKYNLTGSGGVTLDPEITRGRKIILVPGQVEAVHAAAIVQDQAIFWVSSTTRLE